MLRATRALVEQFSSPPADPDALRRAYDIAGAAILERMAQLDRALRMVPELSVAEPEDRQTLERSRGRFQVQQAAVLEGVAAVLARRIHVAEAPLPAFDRDGRYLRVCAWCRRVAMANGTWLPVGHYLPSGLPPRTPFHLSHGICPDCIPTVDAAARARLNAGGRRAGPGGRARRQAVGMPWTAAVASARKSSSESPRP